MNRNVKLFSPEVRIFPLMKSKLFSLYRRPNFLFVILKANAFKLGARYPKSKVPSPLPRKKNMRRAGVGFGEWVTTQNIFGIRPYSEKQNLWVSHRDQTQKKTFPQIWSTFCFLFIQVYTCPDERNLGT